MLDQNIFETELQRATTQGAVEHQGVLFVDEVRMARPTEVFPTVQAEFRSLTAPEKVAREIDSEARAFLETHLAGYWKLVPREKRAWFLKGFTERSMALKFIHPK